jgi:hypothetical protein
MRILRAGRLSWGLVEEGALLELFFFLFQVTSSHLHTACGPVWSQVPNKDNIFYSFCNKYRLLRGFAVIYAVNSKREKQGMKSLAACMLAEYTIPQFLQ